MAMDTLTRLILLYLLFLTTLISPAGAFLRTHFPRCTLLSISSLGLSESENNEANAAVDSEIIIIGGGLVGMATGVALSRRGLSSCTIYEQAQELRQVGAAIGLYPNGLSALGYISPAVLDLVKSTASPCQVFERRDLNNDLVQVTNVPNIKATAPVMYAWFLLQQHFAEALPRDCVQLGYTFESYKVLDSGLVQVSLQHKNTTVVKTCQLLIGADGIHSKVRRQLVGAPTNITYLGKVMYRAVLDKELVDCILEIPDGSQISWQGNEKGKSFSLRETTKGIVTVTAAALGDPKNETNNHQLSTKKQRLEEMFQEFPDPVHQIISRLAAGSIHEDFVRDVNIPEHWSEGPVVILGDAAHAMSPHMGQGANQGLEDVCELVERIRHHQPLSDFCQARLSRVTEIQYRSRQNTIQSNTFDKKTASIPFQRREYSASFKDRLYNWKPPSLE